jgi:hypothetical protein
MVYRTTEQVQLHCYHQPRRAGATEPEEDKLMTELERELLACAIKLRAVADWLPHPHCVEAIEMADAAIAKAKAELTMLNPKRTS